MKKNAFTSIELLVTMVFAFVFMLTILGFFGTPLWEYFHQRDISGRISAVEKISDIAFSERAAFSWAVSLDVGEGEQVTASTEDRQWATAKVGNCAEMRVFPYPPWDFQKAGTFHDARLLRQWECK